MEQWQAFTEREIRQAGYREDFYPFSSPIGKQEIETSYLRGENTVGCRGARKHIDYSNPKYSAILVVRNEGWIAKPYRQSRFKYKPQVVGTIIILNVHSYHHVVRDRRLAGDGYWIGLYQDYERKPSEREVEERFREKLYGAVAGVH